MVLRGGITIETDLLTFAISCPLTPLRHPQFAHLRACKFVDGGAWSSSCQPTRLPYKPCFIAIRRIMREIGNTPPCFDASLPLSDCVPRRTSSTAALLNTSASVSPALTPAASSSKWQILPRPKQSIEISRPVRLLVVSALQVLQ